VSDPIDIKALDEYLKGGSDIAQRYRELGREPVPPELDRRVLDEARAAVASGGGRSRSWLRWGAPVALAASVILAVTVVIESGPQNDASFVTQPAAVDQARLEPQRQIEESKLQDQVAQQPREVQRPAFAPEPPAVPVRQAAPAAAPAAPPPAALAKAESERLNRLTTEEVRADTKALREQTTVTSSVTADAATLNSPAPQVAAEQPSPVLAESVATASARKEAQQAPAEVDSSDEDFSSVSVTGTRARRAGRTAGPRGTISGSAISSETRPAADEDAEHSDPQKWLEEIRELRRAGKGVEADRQWQEFGKAFPNFPVADDDLARKQR
jgi:hypothetical protein